MPTYEYACTSCGEHAEVVQSFRDDPLTECPACGGPLRKVFGSIGVVFKGSGFYKNDSRPAAKESSSKDGQGVDHVGVDGRLCRIDGNVQGGSGSSTEKTSSSDGSSSFLVGDKGPAAKSDSSSGKSDTKAGKSAAAS